MSPLEDLQARADALLSRTDDPATVEAKIASVEGPSRRFSAFIPSQLDRALALASELMKIADDTGGEAGVAAALDEAGRRANVEDVQLVHHAVELFIVHDPEAARLAIPPIPPARVKRAGAQLAGAVGRESALDWFREDPLGNDHHRHWHLVYPGGGVPGPGGVRLQDRQGELFFYMHEQMLARYDAERRALGFGPVVPFADYREPIGEGYEDRPSGQALRDIDRQDTGPLLISELEEQRDRLLAAVTTGAAENGAGPRPLTSELLGALEEPTAGTLWRDVWHHGYGHVITAFVMAPQGGGEPGDIGDTSTAIRDPFFWRWHRHIDDANFALQEKAEPFAFDDAPDVGLTGVELAFEADPATPVDELKTMVARTDGVEHGDHEPFLWRLRAENPGAEERTVTVRIFLAPAEAAEDRRAWIEMDKFEQVLAPGANGIERPGRMASPVRKPAERPPVLVQGPAQTPHEQYCRCGWPYHLLIPRGTPAGMPFRVLAMLTDWELDKVSGDDDCGSMSFCGSRDRYPDTREMGYPFSRPLPGGLAATLEALPTVSARDLVIRHDPRPPR
jgi:tyrosinase